MSHLTICQKLKFRWDFVTLLLLIGDVSCFSRLFLSYSVFKNKHRNEGHISEMSGLRDTFDHFSFAHSRIYMTCLTQKTVLSAAISTSISSVNPPSLLRSAQFNQTTNECGPVTSWFHLLWIASVLISIYVNFTLICCETKENWGCTCAFSQSGKKCSFRWNDDVNCVSSLSRSLKEDCVWFI